MCATICLVTKFVMSKRRVVKRAEMFLSPVNVEEFRTDILEAGTQLMSLLEVEYPSAGLFDDSLWGVTEVVECYSMKGKWVTSWASSAHNEFLETLGICEISGCVTFFEMTCESCVLLARISFVDYLAGGD